MSNWHYQLMHHKESNTYAVHEYYQIGFEDEKPDHIFAYDGWTKDPVTIVGEDVEDIKNTLRIRTEANGQNETRSY